MKRPQWWLVGMLLAVACQASHSGGSRGGNAGASHTAQVDAGSTMGGFECVQGETQACVGPGACSGAQECLADRSGWGECDCGATVGNAGNANAGSNNGGSGNDGSLSAGSMNGGAAGTSMAGTGGTGGTAGAAGQSQGGAGGSAGASGAAGAGGSPTIGACSATTMIDDFEDGDDNICQSAGRSGQWYVYKTGGTITPAGSPVSPSDLVPAQGDSTRAMHFVSTGTNTFADLGFSFVGVGNQALAYDASSYTGIRFQASSALFDDFDMFIQTTSTETIALGGTCASTCSPNQRYSILFQDWNEYEFAFSEFTGGSTAINPSEIRSITFNFRNDTDAWIDNFEFY